MSLNLKLGFGLAQIYGFTSLHTQGVYYRRDLFRVPSREYCLVVLDLARRKALERGSFSHA